MSESSCHSSSNRDSPDASMDADIESESPVSGSGETTELSPMQIEESEQGQSATPEGQISNEMNASDKIPEPAETMKIHKSVDKEGNKDTASSFPKSCPKETSGGPSRPRPKSKTKKRPHELISESDSDSIPGITLKKTAEILAGLMSHIAREDEKIANTLIKRNAKSAEIQPDQMNKDCDVPENSPFSLSSSKAETSKRHLKLSGSFTKAKDSRITSKRTKKRRRPSLVSQQRIEDQPGTSIKRPEDTIEASKRSKGATPQVFRNKAQRTDAEFSGEGNRRDSHPEIEIEARRKKWVNPVADNKNASKLQDDSARRKQKQKKEIKETIVLAEFYNRCADKSKDAVPWRSVVSGSDGPPEARFLSDSPPEYHFGDVFVDTGSQATERQSPDYMQSLPSTSTGIYAAELPEEAFSSEVPFREVVSPDYDPGYDARRQTLLRRVAEMQEISGILDWNILDLQSEDFYDYVERSTRDHGHPSWRALMLTAYQLRRYHTISSLNEARAWLTSYKVSEEDFFRVYHRVRLTWEKGYLEETSLADLIQKVINCIFALGQMTFAMLFIDIGQRMRKEDEVWMRNEIRQDEEGTYAPGKRESPGDAGDFQSSESSDQLSRDSMSDSSTNIGSEESFEALPWAGGAEDAMSENGASSENSALTESAVPYALKSSSSTEGTPSESTESSISSSNLPSSSTNSDPARLDIPSEDCLSADSAETKYKPFTGYVGVDPNIRYRKMSFLSLSESARTAAEEPRPSSILVPIEELLEEQHLRKQFQELEGVRQPPEEELLLHEEDSAPEREPTPPVPSTSAPLPSTSAPLPSTSAPLQSTSAPLPSTSAPVPQDMNTTEETPNLGELLTAATHVAIAEMLDTISNLILNDPTVEFRDDVGPGQGGRDKLKRKENEDSDDEFRAKIGSKRFHPE